MDDNFYKAAIAHWQSERLKAIATLRMLFTKSVGIGEHPQVVEEMSKQLETLSNAHDCLHVLNKHLQE